MKFFQKILNRIYGIKKNISFPKKRFTCVCGYRVSKGDEFCMRCGMRLRYGELEIEVSGSNTNEVKDVSKAMINELNLKELEITISNYKDTNLKRILKIIEDDNIETALEELSEYCETVDSDYTLEVSQLKSRVNNLIKRNVRGVLEFEEKTISRNEISQSIIHLISLLEKEKK